MKFAILDAETNGLPDYKKPADDPCQPRLAALGVIMVEVKEAIGVIQAPEIVVQAEHEFLVKPDGWMMEAGASAINGLTTERLLAEGIDLRDVLRKYTTLIEAGYVVVAYGAQHDCKILRGELRRCGLPDHFEETPNICLMRCAQPLKVPKANGKGGWPQLDDVLRFVGAEPEPKPHGALVGARCALAVFTDFKKRGVLLAPAVHYAKNRPDPTGPKPAAAPAPAPKKGDQKTGNSVELEFNGSQWLPIRNAHNYPKLYNKDGTPKAHA